MATHVQRLTYRDLTSSISSFSDSSESSCCCELGRAHKESATDHKALRQALGPRGLATQRERQLRGEGTTWMGRDDEKAEAVPYDAEAYEARSEGGMDVTVGGRSREVA